jgi:hypothetical protein
MELRITPDTSEEFSPDRRRASPTGILAASMSAKIGVVLGLLVSSYAVFSLFVFPLRGLSIWSGLGVMCAFFCSLASFVFCWSAVFSYFIRKYNLSPTWCRWAGMPFLLLAIPILVADWFGIRWHSGLAGLLVCTAILIPNACRKLAYPAISPKQVNNLEPRPPGVF